MKSQTRVPPGVPAAGIPGLRFFVCYRIMIRSICQYVIICTSGAPRQSAPYSESTVAVDILARGTAVILDSILIGQRSTNSASEGGTASVLIICKGGGKHPPTTWAVHSIPVPRLSWHHLGPTNSVLPLQVRNTKYDGVGPAMWNTSPGHYERRWRL